MLYIPDLLHVICSNAYVKEIRELAGSDRAPSFTHAVDFGSHCSNFRPQCDCPSADTSSRRKTPNKSFFEGWREREKRRFFLKSSFSPSSFYVSQSCSHASQAIFLIRCFLFDFRACITRDFAVGSFSRHSSAQFEVVPQKVDRSKLFFSH